MLEKIVELLGASPTQYRQLLKAEKLVDKRALEGKRGTMLSLALNCAIFFFMGLSTASMLLLPLDVFTYALISITMSMAMIGIWTIPYFDMLLSPIHYPIVAHTPVSSRTYFLVKLTQVLTHTVLLLASFNLPRLSLVSGFMSESLLSSYSSFRLHTYRSPSCQAFSRLV